MRFASLGSGSRGNATLIQSTGTLLLVDCGFPRRELDARMRRLGVDPGEVDAILVTDSIPPQKVSPKKLRVCSIAPLVAMTIRNIHNSESVSSLFE